MAFKYPVAFSVSVAIFIALNSADGHAEIFKSVDSNGKVVYSDRHAAEDTNNSAAQLLNPPKTFSTYHAPPVNSLPAKPQVVLFATQWCGYCKKERAFLRQHNIAFQEIDTETPQGAQQFRSIHGQGVPVTLINKQRIDGFDETLMRRYLSDAGVRLQSAD